MKKIVFFCIPAHGHTNPTIEVVRELVNRGHRVWYYSFNAFKEKIEEAGAKFIGCDQYLPELQSEDKEKLGSDFCALFQRLLDITIVLEGKLCEEVEKINPDCIVSDSLGFWGKLLAMKLDIPFVSSTTTFAFNEQTAEMVKQGLGATAKRISKISEIESRIQILRKRGYPIDSLLSMFDSDTNTIVYTSKEFQPRSEIFSDKYYFVGPSIPNRQVYTQKKRRKKVYISLGTVNNKNIDFYKNCIKAFENDDIDVVMSIGANTSTDALGNVPSHFEIKNSVDQIMVLQETDVFITHCGMNSVNESLYYSVPMVLFPQQLEQSVVADRAANLGVGFMLERNTPEDIKEAVMEVIHNETYKDRADALSKSFKQAGGVKRAADQIISIAQ